MIKLFEVENGVVKPTVHCTKIGWLKAIQDFYPLKEALGIYAYFFYMSYMGEENPYYLLPAGSRETKILEALPELDNTDLEANRITKGLEKCMEMYSTPTTRAYEGISAMLDRMSLYMKKTEFTTGRDGNLPTLIRLAKDFDDIRGSFNGVAKDLAAEQSTEVRGGQDLAYDQM